MAKRYFWLKLPEDFFRQKPIKKLRKIAGGDTYTIIYLKMLLIAIKQDGRLFFDGVEDEFYDELALELDEDSENVKVTVMFLVRQGLMELVDESEYLLTKCGEMVGSEGSSAARMRQYRRKQSSLCDKGVTPSDKIVTERREEKEIEKEIEIENSNTICSELTSSKQEEQVFIQLPLVTGSGSFDVTFDYLNSLRVLYPGIDIEQEFRKMYGWLDSNPRNRKTGRGIKRFITGWLSRAQDKAPVMRAAYNTQQPKNMTTEQYMQSTANWFEGIGDMNDTTGI